MSQKKNPLVIGVLLIIVYTLLNNTSTIERYWDIAFKTFSPFIYGAIIAFLLNPILKIIEKKGYIKRRGSITIIFAVILLTFILGIGYLIPKIISNISELVKNYPQYFANFKKTVTKFTIKFPLLHQLNFVDWLLSLQKEFIFFIQKKSHLVLDGFIGITTGLLTLVMALILSVFFLGYKKYFIDLTSSITKIFFPKKSEKIFFYGKKIEKVFLGYLIGKSIDSLIIAIIASIGLSFFNIPYIFLIGLCVFLFNFIPYIGPLIGIGIAITITIFTIPSNTIYVFIFLLALQQFDAWFLEPKILGATLNLNMFWTLAAVIIGGSLLGGVGIILAIPTFAFIKDIYIIYINKKNNKEN